MSLKNKLQSYTPLELKEFIKEHNKRARKMISEETKEFRKEQLSKLIIKAVGKKDDLIDKMVNIANTKDISSFKLIKEKGKMSQEKKNQLDAVQTKETEDLAKKYYKDEISEKQLKKELDEIKKERIRAELPKLNVPKLIKFINGKKEEMKDKPKMKKPKLDIVEYTDEKKTEKKEEKKEEKKADKPPQPKRKAPTLAEVRAKNLKEKREAMKPKREPPKRKEPMKPKGKAPAPPKKEEPKKEQEKPADDDETDTEDEGFVLPPFFKNTDPKIRSNIEKAVDKGELPSSSIILTTTYKTMKKIKTAVEKKDKEPEDRIDGLGRGITAIDDELDQDYYKAIYGKKLPVAEIKKEFIKVATILMKGDKDDQKAVRKWINNSPEPIQRQLFNKDKEAYLFVVTGVSDKTGEKRKRKDEIDAAIAKDKAEREKEFAQAKKEQDKEEAIRKKKIQAGEAVKKDVSRAKKK